MTSKRVLNQLDSLRKSLAGAGGKEEGSFSRVFNAFLDAAGDLVLLRAGNPTDSPHMKTYLEACARQLTGDDTTSVQGLRMLRIKDAGFIHGGFVAGPYMGSFFFFEKDQQGLVAFSRFGAESYFSRITLTPLPQGTMPVPRPKGTH